MAATVAVYVQLIFGAVLRHAHDVMGGALHAHLLGAFMVMACVAWLAVRIFGQHASERRLTAPAGAVVVLFIVQVGLGVGDSAWQSYSVDVPENGYVLVVVMPLH